MAKLELEIHHWLKKTPDLNSVSELIFRFIERELQKLESKSYSWESLTEDYSLERLQDKGNHSEAIEFQDNLRTAYHFWSEAQCWSWLSQLVLKYFLEVPQLWPWPHLLVLSQNLKEESQFRAWLEEGAAECDRLALLSQAPEVKTEPGFFDHIEAKQKKLKLKWSSQFRQSILAEFETFRSQNLYEAERKTLKKLENHFPFDPKIQELLVEHNNRYADEILDRVRRKSSPLPLEKKLEMEIIDPSWQAIASSAHENLWFSFPQFRKDILVSLILLEQHQAARGLLQQLEPLPREFVWLFIELSLESKLHLEVLNYLPQVERLFAQDPETFFSAAYFRAQALHGLGQKTLAIEVLESLLVSRPNYRKAESLLLDWRGP